MPYYLYEFRGTINDNHQKPIEDFCSDDTLSYVIDVEETASSIGGLRNLRETRTWVPRLYYIKFEQLENGGIQIDEYSFHNKNDDKLYGPFKIEPRNLNNVDLLYDKKCLASILNHRFFGEKNKSMSFSTQNEPEIESCSP